jgi:uncharacterized membrane protein YhaH (DUF805 family)
MTDVPPPPPPANYGGGGGTAQPMANPLIGYWKKVVLENYANFSGRARRAEFWWYFLANFIISIIFNIIDAVIGSGMGGGIGVIGLIYSLAVLVPGLAVAVRRLHDTGKSGWWLLIALIPLVGIIVLIVFWATDSTPGANDYGMSEKYPR